MTSSIHMLLAPFKLKTGKTDAELIAASDAFEANFVKLQKGILGRQLLREKPGHYADLVVFESRDAAEAVILAELSSPHCGEYFSIMDMDDATSLNVLSFDLIKNYK